MIREPGTTQVTERAIYCPSCRLTTFKAITYSELYLWGEGGHQAQDAVARCPCGYASTVTELLPKSQEPADVLRGDAPQPVAVDRDGIA